MFSAPLAVVDVPILDVSLVLAFLDEFPEPDEPQPPPPLNTLLASLTDAKVLRSLLLSDTPARPFKVSRASRALDDTVAVGLSGPVPRGGAKGYVVCFPVWKSDD